jgi:adenylosuccinate lyase
MIADSAVYGAGWGTAEVRDWFTDEGRTQTWLEILAALAGAQAELGLVPDEAATEIAAKARVELLDLDRYAAETAATGHSTLGLIRAFRELLGERAAEWVYYGATVQDLTDTWSGLIAGRMLALCEGELAATEAALADSAREHRETVMPGRTHGQIGSPITYGFKLAVWVAELRRHRQRIAEARPRLCVGQLCGAVGTCGFWPEVGIELQRRFCARLGLAAPEISWLTARDRIAELTNLLAMVAASLAKIGNEVYNLQRPELGELFEPAQGGAVGSITMPHKRNPERAEQLGSLARLVRGAAALGLEGMVQEHERDGAGWKAEWAFLPQACLNTAAALRLGRELGEGMRPVPERMRRNIEVERGYPMSESVVVALTPRLGKHRAHEAVYAAAMEGLRGDLDLAAALAASPRLAELLEPARLAELLDPRAATGCAAALVDEICGTADGAC